MILFYENVVVKNSEILSLEALEILLDLQSPAEYFVEYPVVEGQFPVPGFTFFFWEIAAIYQITMDFLCGNLQY